MAKEQKKSETIAFSKSIPLLAALLADTYVLYVKTQNFHWNVIDPRFAMLHKFFEEQYESLAEGIDEIAERIRMMQGVSPASMQEFLKLASLKESSGRKSGDQMLKELLHDYEQLICFCHDIIKKTNDEGDEGTADLVIKLLRDHEKAAWMIRSHL